MIAAMKYSHQEEMRDGRALDVLTDDEVGLRIVVSRLGAELVSLARRDEDGRWVGFLYLDNDLSKPASGWANHATVMGYFLHRLKNERSQYRGKEIEGGTHSFLRHKLFGPAKTEIGTSSAGLTYTISPNEIKTSEYPLRVSLALTYSLEGEDLKISFRFLNQEPELIAHLEFGLHPGFAATSFESFRLEMPPGQYRRWFSPDNYLSGETQEVQHPGGEMPFDRNQLPGSYILELVDVPDRLFVYRDVLSGREVRLSMPETPYLTLWSDGGPFLCVEPCWGLTDRHEQRPFEEKDGIQKIAPSEELATGFSMKARLGEK
jgi:galactose mutarotase-like enzyme